MPNRACTLVQLKSTATEWGDYCIKRELITTAVIRDLTSLCLSILYFTYYEYYAVLVLFGFRTRLLIAFFFRKKTGSVLSKTLHTHLYVLFVSVAFLLLNSHIFSVTFLINNSLRRPPYLYTFLHSTEKNMIIQPFYKLEKLLEVYVQ